MVTDPRDRRIPGSACYFHHCVVPPMQNANRTYLRLERALFAESITEELQRQLYRDASEIASRCRRLEKATIAFIDDHRSGIVAVKEIVDPNERRHGSVTHAPRIAKSRARNRVTSCSVGIEIIHIDVISVAKLEGGIEPAGLPPAQLGIGGPPRHAWDAVARRNRRRGCRAWHGQTS